MLGCCNSKLLVVEIEVFETYGTMAPEEFFKTIPDTLDEMSNMILFDSDIIFENNSFNHSGESLDNFWRREKSSQLARLFYDVLILLKQQLDKGTVSNNNAIYSPTQVLRIRISLSYFHSRIKFILFLIFYVDVYFYSCHPNKQVFFILLIHLFSEYVLSSSFDNHYTLSSINYYT